MFQLHKLNGWQRLYIVALVFIYVPFVFLAARDPFVPDPEISQITSRLPQFSKRLLEERQIGIGYESRFGHFVEPVPSIDIPNRIEWDKVQIVVESVSLDASNSLGFFEDLVLNLFKQLPDSDVEKAATEIYKTAESIHEHSLMVARLWIVLKATLWAVAIYAFGYGLGWIYRGFKKSV